MIQGILKQGQGYKLFAQKQPSTLEVRKRSQIVLEVRENKSWKESRKKRARDSSIGSTIVKRVVILKEYNCVLKLCAKCDIADGFEFSWSRTGLIYRLAIRFCDFTTTSPYLCTILRPMQ